MYQRNTTVTAASGWVEYHSTEINKQISLNYDKQDEYHSTRGLVSKATLEDEVHGSRVTGVVQERGFWM